MTIINIPSELYGKAAQELSNFGVKLNTDQLLSVQWALETEQYLIGYVAPGNIGGDTRGIFYIDSRTPLMPNKTDKHSVQVIVDGTVNVKLSIQMIKSVRKFSSEPEEGAVAVNILELID